MAEGAVEGGPKRSAEAPGRRNGRKWERVGGIGRKWERVGESGRKREKVEESGGEGSGESGKDLEGLGGRSG